MAYVRAVSAVSEWGGTKSSILAIFVLAPFPSQTVDWNLPPIINVLHLKNWRGEAFALTLTIFFGKCKAEFTDPRVGEVLSSSNEAHIPVIVLLLAIVACDRELAVSAVFSFHPHGTHLLILLIIPGYC